MSRTHTPEHHSVEHQPTSLPLHAGVATDAHSKFADKHGLNEMS